MKLAMVFPGQGSQSVGMLQAYAGLPGVDEVRATAAKILGEPFVRLLDEVARETLKASDMGIADVDWLIPHQANVRILEATARKLGIPRERVVVTVDKHGNTSAASIPLALDEYVRAGKIRTGQRVLMEGVGGGFTWGAALATI